MDTKLRLREMELDLAIKIYTRLVIIIDFKGHRKEIMSKC